MNQERWDEYLKLPASEKMDSSKISFRIDDTIERLPEGLESVLCVGVGDGYELGKIPNSTGIDISEESIKICQEKGLNVKYGDMHEIPFENRSFDLVFVRHALEHSIATWITMSELARVAKKYIMIILPDQEIWGDSDWHFLIPTSKQIQSMATKLGFKVINMWHNDLSNQGMSWAIEDGYLLKRI